MDPISLIFIGSKNESLADERRVQNT